MADVTRSVSLSIGELRLEGVPPHQRFAVAGVLERELARLFAERGVPARLTQGLPPAPAPVEAAGAGTADLGRSIAVAIYEGWT